MFVPGILQISMTDIMNSLTLSVFGHFLTLGRSMEMTNSDSKNGPLTSWSGQIILYWTFLFQTLYSFTCTFLVFPTFSANVEALYVAMSIASQRYVAKENWVFPNKTSLQPNLTPIFKDFNWKWCHQVFTLLIICLPKA